MLSIARDVVEIKAAVRLLKTFTTPSNAISIHQSRILVLLVIGGIGSMFEPTKQYTFQVWYPGAGAPVFPRPVYSVAITAQ